MPPDQDSHHSGYGQHGWMNIPGAYTSSPQTSMSAMHELPPFEYHPTTPMPMEPAYNMHRPSPFAASHAQMPPPLIMPHSGLWPSMLASQPQAAFQTPILPAGPLQTPLSASTGSDMTPTSAKTTTSRRKLTDDERRQMCIEAEQNPNMKQTQIGAKFNVERSTVSKILRQRDKYMHPQPKEESASPGKKSKAKLPDFEKTLTNWVKNQQKKGLPITDEDLRKQAQVFSFSRSDQVVVSSIAWLEKFKRKNHLAAAPKSEGNATLLDSGNVSAAQSPLEASPGSSDGLVSPPMSTIDESGHDAATKSENTQDFFDFDKAKASFGQSPTLSQDFEEGLDHASENVLSPISPEITGGDRDGMALLEMPDGAIGIPSRQRSQTYPHVPSFGTGSRPSSSRQKAPALPMRSLTSVSETAPSAIDPRQMMKRHKSVPDIHYPDQPRYSSMQPPPLPRSADTSPVSDALSPSEDDNIRALKAIKELLEQNPNVAEPDDYMAIGKLMEKLKILRPAATTLPGGMHPIDMVDSPRLSKKRTFLGIST
ncbi:hypothetical protein LTR10_020844 [Elasticomyces elasticus]|uniref:HTH CENPB-type domain-containing protein n=1 Tax=Exophiala sideris TaxID=1016849 RepID=A0ABR0J817_9EURO|nr:hypothetical protein LTR10_020844 [Elasticomyces elasticus]KAK5058393.1 hypothetical protein LTR69_006798 [Exophiala sideris]